MADEEPVVKKIRKTEPSVRVTARAPVNIAVIKYWGKRDEDLILPLNSSLSVTLNWEELCTKTTVVASTDFKRDALWINGREQPIAESPRIQKCIARVKQISKEESPKQWQKLKDCGLHICSENNFPTAAGLASSASGHACLVFTLSTLFHLDVELSSIARQGSGSACRSMYGGFVMWEKGTKTDGTDSIAKQVATEDHWPSLRILILVINDERKSTPSTTGMRRSTETSELLKFRAEDCVPRRIKKMKKAIQEKNFETFAELTMKDSNQFHAVCQDTYPPIEPPYMNSVSHSVVQLVMGYNKFYDATKVAYSFDAGPNAVIFLLENQVSEMLAVIKHYFPPSSNHGFIKGMSTEASPRISRALMDSIGMDPRPSTIKYIISTKAGSGPTLIHNEEHLLDEHGLPLNFK